ncbi:MAG: Adenylate cyclase [Verrucomicrobiota bacterium]|jgi:class 3 adenylate cyclase
MLGLNRLSIQTKMILLLLAVSLSSIAVVALNSFNSGRAALIRAAEDHLMGVQVAKTTTLKAMLDSLRDQVISISDSHITVDGMKEFSAAYKSLNAASLTAEQKEKLEGFYENDFLPKLAEQIDGEPVLDQYLPLKPAEQYLQYHYISNNPHPYGKKQELSESEFDQSAYAKAHKTYHKSFERVVEIFGFEDVMLIDAESMDIVYSYQKTSEFATNLETGPYANTLMASKVRTIRGNNDRDDFKIADFESYRPSLGKPMGFAVSPIFDGPQMIGLLALQFPIENFNTVLTGNYNWAKEGMGQTGETYLVGPDKTMRSQSRFMHSNPKGFVNLLRQSSVPTSAVERIERQGDVICAMPVDSESVEAAFHGQKGIMVVNDYRGEETLSAYGPLELDSLRWAVITEKDLAEVEAPIHQLGRTVLIVASGMAFSVTLLALMFSHLLTRPLRALTEGAHRLGRGETDVQVRVKSRDEFGELGRVFNQMSENIKLQTERLEGQVRENQELLHSILPASAVAQRQEGDEKANREFADVSVLFAEIVGMEELGSKLGEAGALSVLGDLIEAFDEAAEESGIEKVKTIGGSYLAVCGLSVTRPDHARRIIQFAQQMERIIRVFNREEKAHLAISIGINCGPVVGGVVGRRKFLYDLWGDTVTIAKKLSVGNSTAIRVTSQIRERIGDQFNFGGSHKIETDGKPAIEAWEVVA